MRRGSYDQFASMSKFGWILGKSPGHAGLACQGRWHATLHALELSAAGADCFAVWPPALMHHSWCADLWFPLIVWRPFIAGSIVGSAAVSRPGDYLLQRQNRK
jgi:hypothetical protein